MSLCLGSKLFKYILQCTMFSSQFEFRALARPCDALAQTAPMWLVKHFKQIHLSQRFQAIEQKLVTLCFRQHGQRPLVNG